MSNTSHLKYEQVYQYVRKLADAWPASENRPLPTDKELADQFNVSRITVTRAMQKLVDEGIVQRIRGKGSFVSETALPGIAGVEKDLPIANKNVVLVILPFSNKLASDILVGAERQARQCSKRVMIQHSDDSFQRERKLLIEASKDPLVSGVILYPTSTTRNVDALSHLIISKVPIVLLDREVVGLSLPVVSVDNQQAFQKITTHLFDQGHRRIQFVSTQNANLISEQNRFKGFCDAHLAKGRSLPCQPMLKLITERTESARTLLSQFANESIETRATAWACVNDDAASIVIRMASKMDIAVPGTLSVTGFDDLEFASHLAPSLTTIHQPGQKLGQQALLVLESLMSNGRNKQPQTHVDAELIVRDSVYCKRSTNPI